MTTVKRFFSRLDQRYFQLAFLMMLTLYGVFSVRVTSEPLFVVSTFLTAQVVQYLLSHAWTLRYDWRSALITSFSLTLLLKVDAWWVAVFAATVAIASKFVLRYRGSHIFNPANVGIVSALVLFGEHTFMMNGWSGKLWLIGVIVAAGLFVTRSVRREQVSMAFFVGAAAALLIVLGGNTQSFALLAHEQLVQAGTALFAFFMISDPRTTPEQWWAQILFGVTCGVLAVVLYYYFNMHGSIFYALFITTALFWVVRQRQVFRWRSAQKA